MFLSDYGKIMAKTHQVISPKKIELPYAALTLGAIVKQGVQKTNQAIRDPHEDPIRSPISAWVSH